MQEPSTGLTGSRWMWYGYPTVLAGSKPARYTATAAALLSDCVNTTVPLIVPPNAATAR